MGVRAPTPPASHPKASHINNIPHRHSTRLLPFAATPAGFLRALFCAAQLTRCRLLPLPSASESQPLGAKNTLSSGSEEIYLFLLIKNLLRLVRLYFALNRTQR